MIERALIDYYRCPEQFVKISVASAVSTDSGFFRFGPDICWGESAVGTPAQMPVNGLHDTLPALGMSGGSLQVPFDPSQVIDNLRLERYDADSRGMSSLRRTSWQRPYYTLRRFMPAALRRALQRTYLRDWKSLPFPRWPVDDTVGRILERLVALSLQSQGATRMPFVWFWPDGAPSCAILTHDVETAFGRDRCGWLMDVDDSHGMKASFQIVPEERYTVPRAILDEIRARGFEINVHDLNHDGRLFSSREEFLRRARRINDYVREFGARGFRSGGLHRRPEWYEALEIDYDMSVPNVGHLEIQRGGCCTVMPYFVGRIVELPLTMAQDYSLFHVLKDFSNEVWKSQIEALIARHGLLSVIAHPDYTVEGRAHKAYRALLERLARLREAGRCWMALPGEVERWWRDRSRMTLVREADRWHVEGPGSERARVAYAELDGDGLAYHVEPVGQERERTAAS